MSWSVKYTQKFWNGVEKILKGLSKDERVKILRKLDVLASELQETVLLGRLLPSDG